MLIASKNSYAAYEASSTPLLNHVASGGSVGNASSGLNAGSNMTGGGGGGGGSGTSHATPKT